MLEVRYIVAHSVREERGRMLLQWLLDHGADEFSIIVMALQDTPAPVADAFEEEVAAIELLCPLRMQACCA